MKKNYLLLILLFCIVLSVSAQDYTFKGGRDDITGLTRVELNGKFGYIDDTSQEIIRVVYDELGDFGDGHRLVYAKYNGKYGFYNANGKLVTDFKYDGTSGFDWDNRLASVFIKRGDGDYRFGYIDLNGNEVIPLIYELALPFSDGYAAVFDANDKIGFINENGQLVIPYQYDDVKWGFFNGFVWVKKNGYWGMIDKSGNAKISFIYPQIEKFYFSTGFADVIKDSTTKYYYDKYGRMYTSTEMRKIANDNTEKELASLDWVDFKNEVSSQMYSFKVGIMSKSQVTDISYKVEGNTRGMNVVKKNIYDLNPTITVSLNEGLNKIIVYVTNAAGTRQFENVVNYSIKRLPKIEWSVDTDTKVVTSSPTFVVNAIVNSETPISDAEIIVNGEHNVKRGIKLVTANKYTIPIKETIHLREGINTIQIFARNASGSYTTDALSIDYVKPSPIVARENRIALVIGNDKYEDRRFSPLRNAKNDAVDMAAKLRELDFTVIEKKDVKLSEMNSAIIEFERMVDQYDVALFYYAGHGLQYRKKNYLVPTDAVLPSENFISSRCINSDEVINVLDNSKCKMKVIIVDACRSEIELPESTSRSRGNGERGLAPFDPPAGIKVARSTRAGCNAYDGIPPERNSPYAAALLKALDTNEEFETLLKNVFDEVVEKTKNYDKGAQYPDEEGFYTGKFFINNKRK